MGNYIDQFCISCKNRYQKEKFGVEYCRVSGEKILVSQKKCNNWVKKSLWVDRYYE